MVDTNQREEAQVTTILPQPKGTSSAAKEVLLKTFVGQGKQTGDYSKNLGIGYIAGGSSAYNEALEECLHISELVNGAPVTGIHYSAKFCRKVLRIEVVVLQLLKIWEDFFETHFKGSYLQYFYGDAGNIVYSALSRSLYRKQITVVGINPFCLSDHEHAYYFRSKGSCSTQHGVTTLSRHPDAQGICTLRINDPTFRNAIKSPFLELIGVEEVDSGGQNNSALPDAALVNTTHSDFLHVQLGLAKDSKFGSGRQIHRLVNAVFSCFKLTGYLVLPSIQCFSRALQVAITTPGFSSESSSSAVMAFTSGLTTTSGTTVKPEPVIPGGIFPCGVQPDGRFSLYANCSNCNRTYPYGYFPNASFPYGRFFRGKLTGKGKPVLLRLDDPLRKNTGYYATNVPPCNITADGVFHNQGHDYAPYGDFLVGARHLLFWMHHPELGFPYERFFNGSLLVKNHKDRKLPDSDPIMQNVKHNNLTNWTLPDIYPGNIFPNGSFLDLEMSQPFGAFSDNFPYKEYFFGNFSYRDRFLEHLKEQRSTSTVTSFTTSTLFSTLVTLPSIKSYPSEASTPLVHTSPIEIVDIASHIYHGFSAVDLLLAGFWSIHFGCELLLVGTVNYQGARKIKAIALGISCGATYAQIVDLFNNIISMAVDPCDAVVRSSLCVYSSIAILKDAVRFAAPCLREKYYSISRAITYFNASKSAPTIVNTLYKKEQKNSRITSALLGLLVTGIIGALVKPGIHDDSDSNRKIASIYGTIQAVFVAFIALMLAGFLLCTYRSK